jgi:hypothetical protein
MQHGANPQNADAFAVLALVFAAVLVVTAVLRMFGGSGESPEAIEQKQVNGRMHLRHPTLGWYGATHSRTTGAIEGWEACQEPQDLEAPIMVKMPDGTQTALARGRR